MRKVSSFFSKVSLFSTENRDYISGWGEGSIGSPNIVSYDKKSKVFIGKYVSLAEGVNFLLGMNYDENDASKYPINRNITDESERGDITVCNDVRIGADVTIIGPLIIADGVIIEDNSVVVDDLPAYAIVSGSPARVIRYRYNSEQIKKLLDIMWWNWGSRLINERKEEIYGTDIGTFITKYS